MAPLSSLLPDLRLLERARAEEFARALDAPAPRPGRVASFPPSGPAAHAVLARRVSLAGEQLAPVTTPRPEFRNALRTRLVAVAAVQPAPDGASRVGAGPSAPARGSGRAARASAVVAGVTASVVALGGVAAASSQSLPGDPFYGVKRTAEAVQLATADGQLERGQRHLDFAATRLRELRGLTLGRDAFYDASGPSAADGGPAAADAMADPEVAELVRQTLADMDAETRKGTELLTSAFLTSQTQAPLQALSRFATRQSSGLERLLPALPRPSQELAIASLALVVEVVDETEDLMAPPGCQPGCVAPPAPQVTPTPTGPAVVESPPGEPGPPTVPQDPSLPDADRDPVAPVEEPDPEPATPPDLSPAPSPSPSPSPPASPSPAPSPTSSDAAKPLPFLPLSVDVLGLAVPDPLRTLRYLLLGGLT